MTQKAAKRQAVIDQISMEFMAAHCEVTETVITADISTDYLEGEDRVMGNYLIFGRHGRRILIAPTQATNQITAYLLEKIHEAAETNTGQIEEKLPVPVTVMRYIEVIFQAAGYICHFDNDKIMISWLAKA